MSLLIIAHDRVGPRMAGPGIRYLSMAREMAEHLPVQLAFPSTDEADVQSILEYLGCHAPKLKAVAYRPGDEPSLIKACSGAQMILYPPDVGLEYPQLLEMEVIRIIDGYDPLLIEWLNMQSGSAPEAMMQDWHWRLNVLEQAYRHGDFFICASERQRDWWLGQLEARGRVNPHTFRADPSLRQLVDVVPYGMPQESPPEPGDTLARLYPGIAEGAKTILWGGGLWPWLDPLTALRALALARREDPRLVLLFPGTRHPNPAAAHIPTLREEAIRLAADLGLDDGVAFFGDWLEHEDWLKLVWAVDLGLSLHHQNLEARLAFRSRVVDYLWAGLPIVATEGEYLGDAAKDRVGTQTVPPGDVERVAKALLLGLNQSSIPEGDPSLRASLSWDKCIRPLLRFCRAARPAADHQAGYRPRLRLE